jgi:hypothetical protein
MERRLTRCLDGNEEAVRDGRKRGASELRCTDQDTAFNPFIGCLSSAQIKKMVRALRNKKHPHGQIRGFFGLPPPALDKFQGGGHRQFQYSGGFDGRGSE